MFLEANVTILSSDFTRSVKFYSDVLGMRLVFRNAEQWAELTASGLTVGIAPAPIESSAPSPRMALSFNVMSLESAIESLSGKGVKFESDIVNKPSARTMQFADPDGNPIFLCEVKKAFPEF